MSNSYRTYNRTQIAHVRWLACCGLIALAANCRKCYIILPQNGIVFGTTHFVNLIRSGQLLQHQQPIANISMLSDAGWKYASIFPIHDVCESRCECASVCNYMETFFGYTSMGVNECMVFVSHFHSEVLCSRAIYARCCIYIHRRECVTVIAD